MRWWSEWRSPSGQNSSLPFLPNGAAAARMGAQVMSAAWYGSGGEEEGVAVAGVLSMQQASAHQAYVEHVRKMVRMELELVEKECGRQRWRAYRGGVGQQ
uniref:Uncharacterized protein n=1 Tax=Oryza meridionalis TaxID=40149 RepID=A0A0E0CGG8_9ORYZ